MREVVLVPLANSGKASSDLPEATKKAVALLLSLAFCADSIPDFWTSNVVKDHGYVLLLVIRNC